MQHRKYEWLTVCRGIVAWWVVFYHGREWLEQGNDLPFTAIAEFGYLGVDFFFVLSGFVIHYSSRHALVSGEFSFLQFVRNRIFRIYPVHVLVLFGLTSLPLALLVFSSSQSIPDYYSMGYFIASIFLVQSWAIPIELKWNTPAWSVSCEVFTYLSYAIVCFFIASARNRKFSYTFERRYLSDVLGVAVALGLFAALAIVFSVEGAAGLGDKIERLGLFRCVVEFSIGVALAHGLRSGIMMCSIFATACSILVLVLISENQIENYYYAPVVISAMILAVTKLEDSCGVRPTWLMRSLGEWSYSTYIVHYPVKLWVVAFDLSVLYGAWLTLGVYIGLTLGLSVFLYYCIEIPFVRLGRRYSENGRRVL